jgi:hypothetical protein
MWDSTREQRANSEGWRLATTIDNGDTHPVYDVATYGPKFKHDRDAVNGVIAAARSGSEFHQQALQLVIASRARATPRKKK